MEKRKLTDSYIKNVEVNKRTEIFDKVKSGLALRVSPTGYKSFIYRYRFGGRIRRYTIGNYPSITLAKAREKIDLLKAKVIEGNDPQAEKQKRKNHKTPKTIGELCDIFRDEYIKKRLKESTQKSYLSRLNKIDKKFKYYSVDELTRTDIKKFLKKIAKAHPYNANRIHSIFSKMYTFAFDEEFTTNQPLKRLPKFGKEEVRETNYFNDDIRDLWKAITTEKEPMQSLIKTLLLTGQRLGETSRMKWNDIDPENALWIIPKSETKGDRTHIVPISEQLGQLLEELHPLTGSSDYVFKSSRKNNAPLSSFGGIAKRLRKKTGLDDFELHDLRHIVATNMQRLGIEFMHIGKVLNHKGMAKEYAVTSRYIDYDYLREKREALNKWNSELEKIINGKKANIFNINVA